MLVSCLSLAGQHTSLGDLGKGQTGASLQVDIM